MNPSSPDIVARLRAFAAWPSQTSILLHASEAIALLARIDAAEVALREELAAIEDDITWAEASQLDGLIMRRDRIDAALSHTTPEGDGK